MTISGALKPTARLRFVKRDIPEWHTQMVLQQWWAPAVPAYMVDPKEGEWRDVAVEAEAAAPP